MHQRNWRTVFDSVKPFKVLESIKTDLLCCLLLMSLLLSYLWKLYPSVCYQAVLFISTITIKCNFQAWKCPRIFLPFIKYQEFRISFACLLLESKNVKFLILETLSCYVEVKILISVDRARGDQQQQRAASRARWREGDNTGGRTWGRRALDTGTWAYIMRIMQNISPFGYIIFVVFFNRFIVRYGLR